MQKKSRDQNLKKKNKKKNTFPMEFFNEIWLKVGEHKYIYIFEIKFEKKNIYPKMAAETSFVILCNSANWCLLG